MKFPVAFSFVLLWAGTAQAQTVDRRHAYQQGRIAQGVASGRLTPGEAAHVERQQGRIDWDERRMRAQNGGYLTPGERGRLQAREDRASRHIYNAKHNWRRD